MMNNLYPHIDAGANSSYNPFQYSNNDNIEDAEVISEDCHDCYQSAIVGITDDDMSTMAALLDDADSEPQLEFEGEYSRGEGEFEVLYDPLGLTIFAKRYVSNRTYVDEWSQGIPRYEVETLHDQITVECVMDNNDMELPQLVRNLNTLMNKRNTYPNAETRAVWIHHHIQE